MGHTDLTNTVGAAYMPPVWQLVSGRSCLPAGRIYASPTERYFTNMVRRKTL